MRSFLVICSSVLASIGVGLGSLALAGSTATSSTAQLVLTASRNTVEKGSADLQISITVSGLPGGTKVSATGTGQADLATGATQLQLTYGGLPALNGTQLLELFTGGNAYVRIPQLMQSLPSGTWIAVPTGKLASSTEGVGLDPAALLRLVEQQGGVVSDLGSSTLDGSTDEVYAVSVSSTTLKSDLQAAQLPANLEKSALQIVDATDGLQFKVWVNSQSELQQVSQSMNLNLPNSPSTQISAVIDFQDLGSPVNIEAPNASQVISYKQFLKDARGQAS